ncbi:hypothetical protein H6H03_23725 [Nostoc paludosum FACHB-159]|uniref:Uncharacterized protein n=1 Tax=Nostoc paludosum FACHB-159 TaxID=2692908 RepID=A0ABR8KBF3_9NOSO|nr:hypothetical protein [Nostoc paludosum FACHB-159]
MLIRFSNTFAQKRVLTRTFRTNISLIQIFAKLIANGRIHPVSIGFEPSEIDNDIR